LCWNMDFQLLLESVPPQPFVCWVRPLGPPGRYLCSSGARIGG
jgi:hypothetical protein